MNEANEEYSELPDAVAKRLAERDRVVGIVAPETDRAVRALAEAHFASRTAMPERRAGRRWHVPAALAAGIVFALLMLRPAEIFRSAPGIQDDVDGSGQVDILDVLALARMTADDMHAHQLDVDALAARIVALTPVPP